MNRTWILMLFGAVALPGLMGGVNAASPDKPGVTVQTDQKTGRVEIAEAGVPVLRFNFKTVQPPERVAGQKYAEPRSDYIHPLYGPVGEVLTRDFANDHPHHRGVYWAWPEVGYKGQLRDLHALQGLFARPVKMVQARTTPTGAVIEAESVWKWDDKEEIVKERAIVTVHAADATGRLIDFEFHFAALADGVTVARRGQRAYGGLNLRTLLHKDQNITRHTDPADAKVRRSWAQLVGVPVGGKGAVGIAIFQHPLNPEYPGDWVQYPRIAWLQPTFPTKGTRFTLATDKPLVLRYRYWIRNGAATDKQLAAAWDAYVSAVPGKAIAKTKTEEAK